jgi:flagellin FlaB
MEQKRRSMRKDKKGFTGLEAAIVLTAFVVVAAVFSYVVLNAGFFTTEKAKEVVHTGVETATSAVVLAGDIIAVECTTTTDTVATLCIPLKLSAGRGSIQVGSGSTDSNLTIAYADDLVYSARCVK